MVNVAHATIENLIIQLTAWEVKSGDHITY